MRAEVRALEPCPFCGTTDLRLGFVDGYASVGCWKCHVTLEANQSTTPADEWNRRATSPLDAARLAVVEAAKAYVDCYTQKPILDALDALERIEKEADGG